MRYIPVAYHPVEGGSYYLLRTEGGSPEFFLCIPPEYAIGENVGERGALRAILEHNYGPTPKTLQTPIAPEDVQKVLSSGNGLP